jgi:hypothetical protein
MKLKNTRLASMLTSALLLATSLVTFAAAPANADAPAPAIIFDYESNTVGMNGWANVLGYTSANDGSAWGNYVNASDQAGGSTYGTKMVKGQKGNATSNTAVGSIANGSSLISSTTRTATMRFYAPEAGKQVQLQVTKDDYSGGQSVTASAVTTVGWQTLTFVFPSSIDFTQSYNRANVSYDIDSTVGGNSSTNYVYFYDDVSFNGAPLAPPTLYNYESNTVGMSGWANILGYTSANDNSAWGNYVNSADQAGGSATGTKMVKGQKGNATSNTAISADALASGASLISYQNRTVTMNFYAPAAGKTVVLGVQTVDYSATLTTSATATTTLGWQTLTFTFPTSANYGVEWRRAWVAYEPERTTGGGNTTDNVYFYDDVAFNGATPAALTAQNSNFTLVTTMSQSVQYSFETKPAGWEAFEGASGDLVATPSGANAPSGTYSGYITESDAVGVQTWAGLTVDVRPSSELISANSKIVQLRVKAPTATTSVTIKLEAPGNDPGGSTPNLYVQQSATAGTTSWQVLTFDFTSPSAGNYTEGSAYNKIVLFFNLGTKDPISQTLYFDDLAFTPNAVDLSQSAAPRTGENKGNYPHIRLDKSFMDTYLDATWWDGVWQYRDEDTRAYLKYIPVRSTFKLTYTVTDKDDKPLANAPVTLIVNANYSCAKTFFMYENTLIGPDDCAGNGETQLPAKLTDADGKVTFVLTNTNAEGEKMPASLNGAPNGKELGTNIKPHLVGATREGIDMLFAHFVEQSDAAKIVAPATETVKTGTPHVANFQFLDEAGKPMVNQLAEVYINGVQSKQDWVLTDAQGRVGIPVPNPQNLEGTSAVAVSVKRTGLLPLTATTVVTWVPGAMKVSMAPASNSVEVKVVNAANESVKITINGKSYERTPTTGLVTYKFPATVGKKVIRVTIGKKTFVRGVTVRR